MAIERDNLKIPVSRQCELLGLGRSSLYYRPSCDESYNEHLMQLIDGEYTRHPFYGVPRMTVYLRRKGHLVNLKRIRRLMGLEAIYPKSKRNLSLPEKAHKKYPYLLGGLEITRPDQVWATDITYIRMYRGWMYLTTIMDWFSRYVIAWELSLTLEADFCVATLDRALATGCPEIFNSDQGSQFTSDDFTGLLIDAGVLISMDGKGRAFDNIMVERLWRSVKYEEVYLKDYQTPAEARLGLGRYFEFYNNGRPHQSLDYRTPAEVHRPGRTCLPDRLVVTPDDVNWDGGERFAAAAVTPVALRAPFVTAAST